VKKIQNPRMASTMARIMVTTKYDTVALISVPKRKNRTIIERKMKTREPKPLSPPSLPKRSHRQRNMSIIIAMTINMKGTGEDLTRWILSIISIAYAAIPKVRNTPKRNPIQEELPVSLGLALELE
jgi:hypothetical protein